MANAGKVKVGIIGPQFAGDIHAAALRMVPDAAEVSDGGVLMDMGCPGIAFLYWFLGRSTIRTVYTQLGAYVHRDKIKGDDDALCIIEFENGACGLIETSWARRGGIDDPTYVYCE